MASTSSTRMTVERDAVGLSMSLLLENMSEEARQQLGQWLPEIEVHAAKSIAGLTNQQTSKRRPKIIVAAAIYQAFLEFETRTRLILRTRFISEALGLTLCSVNQAYCHLFDKRVRILSHRIECVRMLTENPGDLVLEIIANLMNALEEQTPEAIDWLAGVREDAISMVNSLERNQRASCEPDVLAAAAVFGAVQRQTTRAVVHVAQKDIAMACRYSPALVSKVWLRLFCEGRLSSAVGTGRRGQ